MGLRNYLDTDGQPVCPICGRAIQPGDSVARVDDCMIHVLCYPAATTMENPCEPNPA